MMPRSVNPAAARTGLAALILLLLLALAAGPAAAEDSNSRYVTLDGLVVNLEDPGSARYLQTTIELEAASQDDADRVRDHMPAVRDRLIHVLGGREPDQVRRSDGREALREEALVELQEMLEELTGEPLIEALYFSNFIIQ